MQALKAFFQQRDLWSAPQHLNADHLMPLLRLVAGDMAAQALDVLEEPIKINGGPNAREVLRMSMHMSLDQISAACEGFGVPEESGWSIPEATERPGQWYHRKNI